jgi:hypothetical protein
LFKRKVAWKRLQLQASENAKAMGLHQKSEELFLAAKENLVLEEAELIDDIDMEEAAVCFLFPS